jgi:hypothetical protein
MRAAEDGRVAMLGAPVAEVNVGGELDSDGLAKLLKL